MKAIHELSQLATLPEFDLFGVPPTQRTVSKDIITEYRPISTINSDAVLTFVVNSAADEYIQLRETIFGMKIRIDLNKDTDVTSDDWAKICPVNYLLHSMFKQIDLEIDGKPVTSTPQTYAYRSYIESLLGFSEDARTSHLTSALYHKDGTNKEAISVERSKAITPAIINKNGTGREIDLFGKLHLDLAFQGRALLGGCTLKVTLVPHEPTFYIKCGTDLKAVVNFLDASLYVHKSKVAPEVVEAHSIALRSAPTKYPFTRSEVRSFNINSGTVDAAIDNIISGVMPRRAIIGMVSTDAFNGSYSKNPYNFKHFNLNFIAAHLNGEQYPNKPYQPDFDNKIYAREYLGLFEAMNQVTTDSCIGLNKESWANGNTLFAFNFAPDLSEGCGLSGHVNPIKKGSLRLELRFSKALTETINVLIYTEYDSLLEINSERHAKIET